MWRTRLGLRPLESESVRKAVSLLISIAMLFGGLLGLWLSIKRDIYFGALPYSSAFLFAGGIIVLLSDIAERRVEKSITDRYDGFP